MIDRTQVVDCARSWIGTPYHHQARVKGVGVDCIGLAIGVCRELGLIPAEFDYNGYSRSPHGVLLPVVEQFCKPEEPQMGSLLIFRIRHEPQHCAIKTDRGIVHAYQGVDRVTEHCLGDWWESRIVGSYKLPGVE